MGAVKRVKNGEWERNRRERLNLTFLELSKLLPDHDPTLNIPKVEILTKSIAYIKELREKYTSIVEGCSNSTMKSEISSLRKQVRELHLRNQQLAELLRTAEISLPGSPAHHTLPFRTPRKWAGKITQSDEQHTIEKDTKKTVVEKSNENKAKPKKKSKVNPVIKKNPRSSVKTVKQAKIPKVDKGETSTTAPLREIRNVLSVATTVLTRTTVSLPSLVFANTGAKTNLMTVNKTSILTTPIMATGIQPVLERNPALSSLGPGTLILSDGRLVTVPAAPPQIIVMPRLIVPKLNTSDSTNTTFVNKVPIPAISSHNPRGKAAPCSGLLPRPDPLKGVKAKVNLSIKKVSLSTANQKEKRTGAKVVKQRPKKPRLGKRSQDKITSLAQPLGHIVDKIVKQDISNEDNNPVPKNDNTTEKIIEMELISVVKKRKISETNMENDVSSVKIQRTTENSTTNNVIPISNDDTIKYMALSNDNSSKDKDGGNKKLEVNTLCKNSNDKGSSGDDHIALPEKSSDVNTVLVNNDDMPAVTETPQNIKHTTKEVNKIVNHENDTILNNISDQKDTVVDNIHNAKQSSSEMVSNITITSQNTRLVVDAETLNSIDDKVPTSTANCYGVTMSEQPKQSLTEISFTGVARAGANESYVHEADPTSCSTNISESQNVKTKTDDILPKINQMSTTMNTCINSNDLQSSITSRQEINRRHDNNNSTNQKTTGVYYSKDQESLKLRPAESTPSISRLNQMSNSYKPIAAHFPTISNNRQSLQVNITESSGVSINNPNKAAGTYSNNSGNARCSNINNIEIIKQQQESGTSSVLHSSKSTQISSLDNMCSVNPVGSKPLLTAEQTLSCEVKKISSGIMEKKSSSVNKSIITDVGHELTNLFPTDSKHPPCHESIFKDTDRNLFMPISHSYMEEIRLSLPHADFSNDLFSSLQVPTGGQHPESISPTAAFLLAFPLVSTSKASELIAENEAGESQHATPTTILQIGNIDGPGNELYHQTSIMIDNNLTSIQESMKLNKTSDNLKNGNNTKHQKDLDSFNKLHQIEINEFVRNDNYPRNNYKEKKHYTGLPEQDLFIPCNKKKTNGKNLDYALPSDVSSSYQEKPFEFASNNTRNNLIQNSSQIETRQMGSNNNQKKDQVPIENVMNPQHTYVASSQPYSYHSFPSGNDFSLPNSNYLQTNSVENDSLKPPQTLPSYQAIPWSSASITVTSNSTDYTATYCSYQQKPYSNVPSKNLQQKPIQNNFEDHRQKDKNSTTGNMLPKFSTNFQFNSNNHSHSIQDIHSYPQTNLTDSNYKLDSKPKKHKTITQRPPVNWMTTPDVRTVLPDISSAPMLPDVMFQPQKDIDFNSATNNVMLGSSGNVTSTSLPNNNQSLYHNTHYSGIDLQLDFVTLPDITSSSKPSRSLSSISNSQQNPQYSWSPSKSSISLLPHIESHMIPSTLPTLVGDLALGTTTPSGPLDGCRSLAMPSTPFIMDQPSKKCEMKSDAQKHMNRKSSDKDCFADRRSNNRSMQEYCQKSHSHQSTNTTSSFLSVSQLVDHVKSEQNSSRRTSKQSGNKNNTNIPKRNVINQQQEKANSNKMLNINNNNNYHPNRGMVSNQRKTELPVYQENAAVGFLGPPPPYKGGSYSAESLIGDHSGTPSQDQISELPPFSVANQFPNQYSHSQKPFMSSSGSDYSQQNMQPLEFHQSQHTHQNTFNYNTHYPPSSYQDNDYHLGLDPFYNFNHSSSTSRNSTISCQTSSQSSKDNRNVTHKRGKRREEPQFKCPPHHPVTTSLTNFNLSTIFPEINDKRAVQGTNTFHPSGSKANEGSVVRPGGTGNAQVGMPPHFPPVNFRPQ